MFNRAWHMVAGVVQSGKDITYALYGVHDLTASRPGLSPRIVGFDRFGTTPVYATDVVFRNNIIVNGGNGTYR